MPSKRKAEKKAVKKKKLHFISTGKEFTYPYYLAVISALKTQNVDEAYLWYLGGDDKPDSKYFHMLESKVKLVELDIADLDFTALRDKDAKFRAAHLKDYLTWKILYEEGGLCLDLDTFSVKDATALLGKKNVLASMDVPYVNDCAYPFNTAIVATKRPHSTIMKAVLKGAEEKLNSDTIVWGDTGPIIFSEIMKRHVDRITIPEFGQCGGVGGNDVLRLFESDGELPNPDTLILHLFAVASGEHFKQITEQYIDTSDSLYARLVKQTLTKEEWCPAATKDAWNPADFLESRGKHYKPIFDWLSTHHCYNIMEIGTFDGYNAIGMIKTSKAPEAEIRYFGFDLFETQTPDTAIQEFSGNYQPPELAIVNKRLESETDAAITLFKGNTNETLPAAATLPQMDIIYVDGGHSIETIKNDWEHVQKLMHDKAIVFFDDYFQEMPFIGCKLTIDGIDVSKYDKTVYPTVDSYTHTWGQLKTQLASVKLKPRKAYKYGNRHFKHEWACALWQQIFGHQYKIPIQLMQLTHQYANMPEVITNTLDMYRDGVPLDDSPYAQWGRQMLKDGKWWYNCSNERDIQNRQKEFIQLYHSIKEKGYDGYDIPVWFDEKGQIHTFEGFNRLNIMAYLGMAIDILVRTIPHGPYSDNCGDYPLAETLIELHNGKSRYAPIDDKRLEGFEVWRPDSWQRLDWILKNSKKEDTVLEIGSCEGFFSRELTRRGYNNVTALDNNPQYLAVSRYVATINGLSLPHVESNWQDCLAPPEAHFDVILFMAIFHHMLRDDGIEPAFKNLELLRGKANKIFFEVPLSSKNEGALSPDLYDFTEDEFINRLEKALEMTVTQTYRTHRHLFVLEREPYSKEYFVKINKEETEQADRLADVLLNEYKPKSVIDMGCATGLYLKRFLQTGIVVLGIDNTPKVFEANVIPADNIIISDMRKPILLKKVFDLCLCIEVAEHIEEEYADVLIDNLCKASKTIVFSAATPGQGGVGHVNCQPKEYWIEKFKKRGYVLDKTRTEKVINAMKEGYHMGWLTMNIAIFKKVVER